MDKFMPLKPRMSEKTYAMSQATGTYAIEVPGNASKDSIAKAVAAQFGVTVTTVNIINVKGKTKRTVRKGGRPTAGKRSDIKKAYVTLKEGDKLPFFADLEEEAAQAEKKAEKEAKKDKKKEEKK
jgi:large subunit ribosomal protein L23